MGQARASVGSSPQSLPLLLLPLGELRGSSCATPMLPVQLPKRQKGTSRTHPAAQLLVWTSTWRDLRHILQDGAPPRPFLPRGVLFRLHFKEARLVWSSRKIDCKQARKTHTSPWWYCWPRWSSNATTNIIKTNKVREISKGVQWNNLDTIMLFCIALQRLLKWLSQVHVN